MKKKQNMNSNNNMKKSLMTFDIKNNFEFYDIFIYFKYYNTLNNLYYVKLIFILNYPFY